MLETLFNVKKAERSPWEMLFIGIFYGSLSILLASWVFSSDAILSKYQGVLVVLFTVMFTLPFMYYMIKNEEKEESKNYGKMRVFKEHYVTIMALMWLFLGLILSYSAIHMILPTTDTLDAQIETYCMINSPTDIEECVERYKGETTTITGRTAGETTVKIFSNNMYVLIITIIFSLIFGAGAIFILAWNASVIAAAVGIFTEYSLARLPLGIARYMIHGFPEIAAYFIAALAGGIVGVAVVRHDMEGEKFWSILQDSIIMIIMAIILLAIAAIIEVYITPMLF